MSQEATISSLKEVLGFPFRDANWRRPFLIGSALLLAGSIIPVVPALFVYGYFVQVMRRVIQGEAPSLPAWDDWSKLGIDGLRALAVSLVYMLPGILVGIVGFVFYFAGIFSIPFLAQSGTSGLGRLEGLTLGSMLIFMAALFLSTLLVLLGLIPWPMATAHFVARDQVGAAFRFGEWWPRLKRNWASFAIAWVVMAGLLTVVYSGILLAYYTLVLCLFIPLLVAPLSFYLLLVGAALFGQSYRESEIQSAAHAEGEV